ncbi:MAG: hypothetical protein Q4G40_12810 [Brachybacterium sp.]|nr:hypothetical protein [Brachybacterium sp.]
MSWGAWFDESIHDEKLEISRPTYGKPNADGVASRTTEKHVLEGYSVEPAGSRESEGDQSVITTRYRVSGPPSDVVREGDSVTWRGQKYKVEGQPLTWVGGTIDHTEFYMMWGRG